MNELTENEKKLFDKFMEYRKQWIKLFFSDIDSVRINKNAEGKLEVWEWYEKEKPKLSTFDLTNNKK